MWWAFAAAVVVVIALVVALIPRSAPASAPMETATPASTATPSAEPTPTPTPTPTGPPANTAVYDLGTLPKIDVFTVLAALPVDADPFGAFAGFTARAVAVGAPVFADPSGQPVGYLPRDDPYDGTTVPVITRDANWVQVLLTGREAVPSQGNPSQVTGWLRVADVELAPVVTSVEVSLSARTIDIVTNGVPERIADDFGSGADATPTPTGRAFLMMTRVEPSFWYTRGHPLVYLSVQSRTLDGFGGADVAVTAFHYHDDRSGSISNGCIRVDPGAITRLAELPVGTPVVIRP
ncbi:L,D-transpeptidase [Microbacterium sp. P03]|uniref:L,D-transpeptidase n=1 Tax=Microbacterium sp. P03 TaxID=3366946 RepID=UPI003745CC49